MGAKYPVLTPKEIIRALEKAGFRYVSQKGSHMKYANDRTDIIIRTFVNAVYLYDDELTITFNLKDGEKLKKLTVSNLKKFEFSAQGFIKIPRINV